MLVGRRLGRLNDEYIQALLNGDRRWFVQHLADDFTCIEASGAVRDKAGFLRLVDEGPKYASYRLDDVRVGLLGDVALVQAFGDFTRPDGSSGASRYTDVYQRIDGDWRVIAAQITPVT